MRPLVRWLLNWSGHHSGPQLTARTDALGSYSSPASCCRFAHAQGCQLHLTWSRPPGERPVSE